MQYSLQSFMFSTNRSADFNISCWSSTRSGAVTRWVSQLARMPINSSHNVPVRKITNPRIQLAERFSERKKMCVFPAKIQTWLVTVDKGQMAQHKPQPQHQAPRDLLLWQTPRRFHPQSTKTHRQALPIYHPFHLGLFMTASLAITPANANQNTARIRNVMPE